MKSTLLALLVGALLAWGTNPSDVLAQKQCPPEVAQASGPEERPGGPRARAPQRARRTCRLLGLRRARGRRKSTRHGRRKSTRRGRRKSTRHGRKKSTRRGRRSQRATDAGGQRAADAGSQRATDAGGQRAADAGSQRATDAGGQRATDAGQAGNDRWEGPDATRVTKAETLVSEAQAACKKGDMAGASAKAKQALATLK